MKVFLFCTLVFVFCIFQTPPVFACTCVGKAVPFNEEIAGYVKDAKAVFSGKVIAVQYRKMSKKEISERAISPLDGKSMLERESNPKILTVKIEVNRWWKGYNTKEITLLTGTYTAGNGFKATGSCEITFREGENVLVFADGKNVNQLETYECAGTGLLKDRSEYLKILGKGRAPK
jgi:flagellar hook assembly protein FlgD